MHDAAPRIEQVWKDLCAAAAQHRIHCAHVAGLVHTLKIGRRSNDAFRKQKASGEIGICARRAHDHRERMAIEADFERRFDRDAVACDIEPAAGHAHQVDAARALMHDNRVGYHS